MSEAERAQAWRSWVEAAPPFVRQRYADTDHTDPQAEAELLRDLIHRIESEVNP